MRKHMIVFLILLLVFPVVVWADSFSEEIQALQSKEAAGIPLTPAEKSLLEEYLTQQQLSNPWLDTSWGSDGWYSANDQYSGGQAFNWIDISTTGTEIWPLQDQDDTWSPGFPLPFSFPFYWMHKDSVYVSANVILKFNAASSPSYSTAVPSNTQPPRIDPWCYDMYHHGTDTVDASHYYYQSFGDSLFVVQFKQARYYNTTYRYDETYGKDLEVLLYSDGRIVFQYDSLRNIVAGSPYNSGIDDSVGTAGLTCGNSFSQGQAITFIPLTGVILANGQVSPISGNTSTNFVYQVKYRNTDNAAPSAAQIYIDDVAYALVDSTGGSGNYYMGVNFYYTTTLPIGPHNYYFLFTYGGNDYRFPETGYLSGPTVFSALSGSYDVGGGANDFATIVDAVNAVIGAGLAGPVVFNVYDGIYDGQVNFPNTIQGLSATNTLTIQAAPGAHPVVQNTTGSTTTNGNGFYFTGADYITIKGFEITNCYYAGVYVYYATGIDSSKYITIEDNYIHDVGPTTTASSIYTYYAKYVNILNNEIKGDYYGINLYYSSYCLVANNLVYGNDYYGIRNYYTTYTKYYYNSVYMNSTYATTNYATYWYNSTGCELKNNIFYNGGSGSTSKYAIYLSGTLSTYPVISDYNDLYAPFSSVGYYTAVRTTLADWRAATLLDAHSISAEPNFVSTVAPFNLHINTTTPSPVDGAATPVAEVTVDFDYEARDALTPDIGADEFLYIFYAVSITPETQAQTGSPGTDVEYYFDIHNDGSVADVFNLSIAGAAWATAIYDSAGTTQITSTSTLPPGGDQWVKVVHSVPSGAPGGAMDTGNLTAVSVGDPLATDLASFTTTALVGVGVMITPEELADTSNTGATVYYDFFVTNTGSQADDYALWTSGAVWDVTIYDSTMSTIISSIEDLAPGGSYHVVIAHEIPWQPPDPLVDAGYFGAYSLTVPTTMDSSLFTTTANIWPPMRVVLTPELTNIQIPAGGGSFNFNAEITNYGTDPYQIRVWNNIALPNGQNLSLFARDVTVAGQSTITRDMTQFVPASAPAGIYTYTFYIANLATWEVWDNSGFEFEKLAGDEAPAHYRGWALLGWTMGPDLGIVLPTEYNLHANFPNPFNPTTTLTYDLPESGYVQLSVYDVTGREVARLVDGQKEAGYHQATFSGEHLASGVYFALFKVNNFSKVQKMLLVK
jgi:parallel beta-helix repeat protein